MLDDVAFVYSQQRQLAEAAAQQVDDAQFFAPPAPDANSIAIIMKHMGGNLRSRWSDFLDSDGEKPDRNRDGEFVTASDSRADIMRIWNSGWQTLEHTLAALTSNDLQRTVLIRGQPHSVAQALLGNLAHVSHHAGQVVLLARTWTGSAWQSLSIPRAGSTRVIANFWGR